MASTLENLADRFSHSVFVNAGLSLRDASTALLVARRLIENCEDAERADCSADEVDQRHRTMALDVYGDGHYDGETLGARWVGWPIVNRIAQAIANAEARGAAAAQTEPLERWIPCSERMPTDVRKMVLVVRRHHGDSPWIGAAWYRGTKREGERRRGDWEAPPWGVVDDVTHWMPLPAGPKDPGT